MQGAIDNSLVHRLVDLLLLQPPQLRWPEAGDGLLIDMGKEVRLSQVEVLFSSNGGPTTAAVYLGNNPTDTKATALSNFTLVSPSVSVSGDHKFPVSSQATGQYVLIWLTSLPKLPTAPPGAPAGNTYYEGQIYNVVVTRQRRLRKLLTAAGSPMSGLAPGEPSDAILLRRHVDGDPDAFGVLFRRHPAGSGPSRCASSATPMTRRTRCRRR